MNDQQEFDMEETLKSLHFIRKSDFAFNGYFKSYDGFKLWIAHKYSQSLEDWSAFIMVGSKTITIPLTITPMWVFGFDKENEGYLHDESQ